MATTGEVVEALWKACRGAQTYRALPDGLRRTHLYALHALEELGGNARVTDIADRVLVKLPNMTRLLNETDAAGWTERVGSSDDKRIVNVRLTPAGRVCLRTYHWDYLDAITTRLEPGDHPDYDVMIAAIDRAVAAIEAATADVDAGRTPGSA